MPLTKAEQALRAWAARILRTFGITPDDYYAIVRLQGGQCPICGKPIPEPDSTDPHFPVDHDHRNGEVRGVPCPYCNRRRIGQWNSGNIEILRRVIAYIEDPPARRHFGEPRVVPGHGKRKRRRKRVSS